MDLKVDLKGSNNQQLKTYNPKIKIKDLPENERPYEKLEKSGAHALSNAELIAIIIKTGTKEETSLGLAQRIILKCDEEKGLSHLHELSLEELQSIPGVGRVKALQIKAVAEISKRLSSFSGLSGKVAIKSSDCVARLFMEEMRHLTKEVFKVAFLNTKNCIVKQLDISVGSLSASIVHPREVFAEAVKAACSAVLFVHNHPSGDPEPSGEDIETTKRLCNAGNIIGIKVLDHIIIGDGHYISFKERGLV
ncbi:MAG: DNA repair protein RadC [Clostridiales bacterium]|nr:DNA repair protein RadC [Clostridiales bacterium]